MFHRNERTLRTHRFVLRQRRKFHVVVFVPLLQMDKRSYDRLTFFFPSPSFYLKVVVDALLKVIDVDGIDAGGKALLQLLQALERFREVVQLEQTLRQPVIPNHVGRIEMQGRVKIAQRSVTVAVVATHQVMRGPSVEQLRIVGRGVDLFGQLGDQRSTGSVTVAGSEIKVKELADALLSPTAAAATATPSRATVIQLCRVMSLSTAAPRRTPVAALRGWWGQLQPIRLFAVVQIVQVDLFGAHVDQQLATIRTEGQIGDGFAGVFGVLAEMPWTEVSSALAWNQVHRAGIVSERFVADAVRELKLGSSLVIQCA